MAARRKASSPPRVKPGSVAKRLATYRGKRDFARTAEPSGRGTGAAARSRTKRLRFVVQKHAARNLHYDFRLELDGVLLSWSVPKGPSLKPADRRLAVRTEDHPLDYAGFEGVIPKGEYGGGTVIVWDRGTWTPEDEPHESMQKGRLTFALHGEKLRGRWHLVRTAGRGDRRENWLLFKSRDGEASETSDLVRERPESAKSGRTIEQVAAEPGRVWHSDRADGEGRASAAKGASRVTGARGTKPRGASTRSASHGDASASVLESARKLKLGFPLTNLEKVLYPEEDLRKADLVAYYALAAPWMLPHVADRPLTIVRCPDGPAKSCFYQKHLTQGVPPAVQRVDIPEGRGRPAPYMFVRDVKGLVALAQLGVLEVHTWMCHADEVERPDLLIFDVDPDVGLAWDRVVETAVSLREALAALGIESFVKTTGGKGLHVVAPVARRHGWDAHKAFAHALVDDLARREPRLYTTNARKAERKGRIYLDFLRNARGATAVAPYSPRAREGATVATPLSWDELARGVDPKDFTVRTVPLRLAKLRTDPWKRFPALRQSIPAKALRRAS